MSCTQSFTVGLVKTEREPLDQLSWNQGDTLVVAGINVETSSQVVNKGLPHQQIKYWSILCICCTWDCFPAGISGVVDIPKVCSFDLLQKIGSKTLKH